MKFGIAYYFFMKKFAKIKKVLDFSTKWHYNTDMWSKVE